MFILRLFLNVFILLFFVNPLINSDIKIIDSINEANKYLINNNKNTLVIFDVDETLIMPKDKMLYKKNFHSIKSILSIDQLLESQIISQAKYKIVEPEILEFIRTLKHKQVKIIALTLSGVGTYGVIKSLEEWRFSKMKEIGLDFQSNFFIDISLDNLIKRSILTTNQNFPPKLYKGILLCNGLDKGTVLKELLKRINWKPEIIIFFDDILNNLKSVQNVCKNLKIKFLGFHYLKAEHIEEKQPVNLNIFKFQIDHLKKTGIWLSDDEVEKILASKYRTVEA